MKFFSPKFRLLLPAFMLAMTIFLFAGDGGYAALFTTTPNPDAPDFARTETPTRHFAPPPPQAMSSACGSLRDTTVGSLTGSATYDACNSDTISISANQFPTSSADRQYNVQREVCGDGEVIVKVLSVSGGMAGLELRADNAPGAKKVGLRTALGNLAQRFGRTTTDAAQSSGNVIAGGHRWLKVVRSGSSVSLYTSTNGSNWNFASTYTISLPDCVQATLFMQSINANTTHTGVFNNLQFSGFTNPEGDPTTVAFDQDTISADAGDTVMICVNIVNPCICSPTEVDVELQGSGSPHLSGYSTETLVFEDTTEQLCFPLVISGAAGSANYTLSLENVSGGNGAETESPASLIIAVTGIDDGSPLYCGVAPPMSNNSNLFALPVAFDRFGNKYFYYQLLPPIDTGLTESLISQGLPGCDCEDLGITLNLFDVWFEDCFFNTGIGFDAPGQLGEDRREVMCATYQYLETLIVPGQANCDPGSSKVNIRVQPSGPLEDYYGSALTDFAPGTLGYASAYYPEITFFNPGIIFGIPQTIINSGEYPSSSFLNSMHGFIRINFNRNWYLDYAADPEDITPSTPETPIHDLFTVCLHESLHLLGFASAFNYNGSLLGSREGQGLYFPFDQFLGLDYDNDMLAETSLIKNGPATPGFTGSPIWSFNNDDISNPSLHMHRSCLLGNPGPNMKFESNTGGSYPISTFNTFVAGSSFSHLDGACGVLNPTPQQTIPYVMTPGLFRSIARRELHPHELDIMTTIGYNIGGNGCAIGSVDDLPGGNCSAFNFTLEICPPEAGTISIPLADLLSNDPGAESIAYIEPLIAGNGSGELSTEGTHYNFTITRLGLTELVYAPLGCDGTLGNSSIISINVVPESDGDCPFYCEDFTTCAELVGNPLGGFCQENFPCVENSCNLICNGKICGTAIASSPDILPALGVDDIFNPTHFRVWSIDGTNVLGSAGFVPGWINAGGTPDFVFESPTYENSIVIGGQNHYTEGIMTFVDLSPGKNYLLSMVTGWPIPELHQNFLNIRLIAGENLIPGATATLDNNPIYSGPIQTIFSANGAEHISEKYSQLFCFSPSEDDYNCIWFHNEWNAENAMVPQSGVFIKDVELIEDDFSAGPDLITSLCNEPVNIGGKFCMMSDVGIEYEWFEVTDDGQGNETLIPIASYQVFNNIIANTTGDINSATHELTVAPSVMTTYRLRRSVFFAPHFTTEPDLCILEDDMTISVNEPVPDASFTYSQNGCLGDFQSSDPTLGLTHEWDFGSLATPSTSTNVNPGGILLPGGTHIVTHTVTGTCGVDTYSEEISVTPGSNAVFTLTSEACGLVTFSLTGLLSTDTWEIDYGNGDSGLSLVYNYSLTPATYTATISITSVCESVEIPLEVAIEGCPELACCPNTSSMLLVNTSISDAIAAGLPPGGTSSDICIEGILMVDEDYTFSGNLFLGPDARIVVTSEATLELDGAHLQGCDFLWRGIEVKQPHVNGAPSLISHNETRIEDAKLAIDADNKVLLEIRKTTFDRNFIGLNLVNVPLSGFHGNTFDCTDVLKPSFSSTPNIGDYAYAGIRSQSASLHIGVAGATVNTFQNLRNGIINLRGPMTVENSVFHNIEKALDEPYDITGYGIHHRGTSVASLDQRGLGYGTNATLTFDNCYTAIWAEKCNVRARFNRMADVHTGIQAQYCKNANLNIDHNRIACYGIGISLLQNDPANSIRVWENHLHVNENSPTNAAGAGIFVQESGSQQFNAIIEQNPVYLYRKDKGIFLNTTTGYTVRDNDVFLESATINDAIGIVMEKSALCRVSCNDIVGVGKGDGLVSRTTSSTLYSCNTVENLSIGAAFDGASGSTYLQTTEFVPPFSQGLVYKENIAMMPVQNHRGNRWNTGAYGVAAAVHEGSGTQDYFSEQRFEIHTLSAPYYPPSISLTGASPSSWFAFTGTSPFSICNPSVECPVFGFAPDKDEVKSREEQLAEDEFAGEWPGGLHWAAQWQLYEMLERSPGIRDTSTVMDSYYTGKGTGALGRLHALQKDIDTLFQLLPEQQDTLQQYIEQTETLMEALALADSMAVHAPLSATPGLPQQLLAQCDSLLSLSEALADEIFDARRAIIDTMAAQNTAIGDTAIYIVNEKVVNEIYFSTLSQDSLALDTLQADTLYAIATQCPETGGPAVYRARSLYALIAMVDFDTINCKSVSSLQSPPQQALAQVPDKQANFRVFPNPNQGRFTIAYELEQDGTLVLTDILGRQAATTSLLADTRSKEVSASELKAGLYYLHIVSGNGELLYSNRIIIIH